jgi:hypothetical protein
VDIAILERKLSILEREQRVKALEINSNLRDMYATPTDSQAWKQEKEKLVAIIKQKNKEIKSFRLEVDGLIQSLQQLQNAKGIK